MPLERGICRAVQIGGTFPPADAVNYWGTVRGNIMNKYYVHPFTRKVFVVEVYSCATQQGNTAHIVIVHPCSGGVCSRFVRYSRGEYRKLIGGQLVPVALSDYYPGLSVRGMI